MTIPTPLPRRLKEIPAMPHESTPRQAHAYLLPTLLERLRDDDVSRRTETSADYMVTPFQMREIIRDALTDLFNTINMDKAIDSRRYPEAAASVINYGIAPIAGGYLSDITWVDVERMVRKAILQFEPRIIPETLRISPPPETDGRRAANMLRFTIQAMIHMDPYPVEFSLQSDLDLETNYLEATLLKS